MRLGTAALPQVNLQRTVMKMRHIEAVLDGVEDQARSFIPRAMQVAQVTRGFVASCTAGACPSARQVRHVELGAMPTLNLRLA